MPGSVSVAFAVDDDDGTVAAVGWLVVKVGLAARLEDAGNSAEVALALGAVEGRSLESPRAHEARPTRQSPNAALMPAR